MISNTPQIALLGWDNSQVYMCMYYVKYIKTLIPFPKK